MRLTRFFILLTIVSGLAGGCRSPYYGDRGAALGGLTGAGVGAILGNQSNKSAEGALIGGALGAISGGITGNALDDIEARNQRRYDTQFRTASTGTATINDVVEMSESGLGEDVIIQHLRQRGFAGSLTSNDLIFLKNRGTSDQVIRAMQDLASGGMPASRVAPASVIVQEHHYGHPVPVHPRHYFSRRRPHHRRSGVNWHIRL